MEQLTHDPRTKQLIKDTLYKFLYGPVEDHFKSRLDVLIARNTLLGGYSHKSFNYKGVHYTTDDGLPPRRRNRLLPQLRPSMDEYLAELKTLNETELPFVIGFVNQVLNASNDFQDYLRVLPPSTHYPIQKLIGTCPCQNGQLTESKIAQMQTSNEKTINMMKQRLVSNLLF